MLTSMEGQDHGQQSSEGADQHDSIERGGRPPCQGRGLSFVECSQSRRLPPSQDHRCQTQGCPHNDQISQANGDHANDDKQGTETEQRSQR
jgi:hypothetical protein